jgi:cytochrome c oxidase cbb3-type subunit 1
MDATEIPLKAPSVPTDVPATDVQQIERALIDASTRVPVLMFYTSAMVWLVIGTFLAGFVSFKLHSPDTFSGISFLTWGRVRPAHMNVMVYGWASMAGMGTAIWLMARLCRTVLRHPLLLVAGAGFWNLGVLLGVGGILWGDCTGYQWLVFPRYAAIILFVAYTLVVSWAVLMFRYRRGEQFNHAMVFARRVPLVPSGHAAGQLMLFVVPVRVFCKQR